MEQALDEVPARTFSFAMRSAASLCVASSRSVCVE